MHTGWDQYARQRVEQLERQELRSAELSANAQAHAEMVVEWSESTEADWLAAQAADAGEHFDRAACLRRLRESPAHHEAVHRHYVDYMTRHG